MITAHECENIFREVVELSVKSQVEIVRAIRDAVTDPNKAVKAQEMYRRLEEARNALKGKNTSQSVGKPSAEAKMTAGDETTAPLASSGKASVEPPPTSASPTSATRQPTATASAKTAADTTSPTVTAAPSPRKRWNIKAPIFPELHDKVTPAATASPASPTSGPRPPAAATSAKTATDSAAPTVTTAPPSPKRWNIKAPVSCPY